MDGYCLESPTDAAELERLIAAGRGAAQDDPRQACSLLGAALALWRSRPYPELDHVEEAIIEARRLDDLADSAREALLAAQLETGMAEDLVSDARRLAAEQPYRERRWELLMLALYRSGSQAEALDAYAEARRRLLDDLGLEPGRRCAAWSTPSCPRILRWSDLGRRGAGLRPARASRAPPPG